MVHTLARIALAQFLADETGHHTAHPLFTDNGITGIVNSDVVLEVDTLVGWGDGGLFGEEGSGFGGRHCGWFLWWLSREREAVGAGGVDNGSKSGRGETCQLKGSMRWSGVDLEGWITCFVIGGT